MNEIGSISADLRLDYSDFVKGLTISKKQLSGFGANVEASSKNIAKLESSLKKSTGSLPNLANGFQSTSKSAASAAKSIDKTGSSVGGFSIASLGSVNVVKTLTKVVAGLGVAAAGAALILGVKAVKAAAEFSQEIKNAGARIGATPTQLASLANAAQNVGIVTSLSAKQAAEGITELSKAGLSASEQVAAIEPVARFAEAGLLSLADAASISVNVLAGYNKPVSEMAAVNDVLVLSANSVTASVQDIGEAMSKAGPLASSLGIELEDTVATIARLKQAGLQASVAGSTVKVALTSMLKPSKDAADAQDRLGVSFKNLDGSIKSPIKLFNELGKAGASSSDLIDLFGRRAGPNLASLLGEGSVALTQLRDELNNAGGTAAEISALQLDTFSGSVTRMEGSLGTLLIQIGTVIEAGLRPLSKELASSLDSFLKSGAGVNIFGNFLLGALKATSAFADQLLKLAPVFNTVIQGLGAIGGAARISINLFQSFQGLIFAFGKAVIATFTGVVAGAIKLAAKLFSVFGGDVSAALDKASDSMAGFSASVLESSFDSLKGIGEDFKDAGKGADLAISSIVNMASGVDTVSASAVALKSNLEASTLSIEQHLLASQNAAAGLKNFNEQQSKVSDIDFSGGDQATQSLAPKIDNSKALALIEDQERRISQIKDKAQKASAQKALATTKKRILAELKAEERKQNKIAEAARKSVKNIIDGILKAKKAEEDAIKNAATDRLKFWNEYASRVQTDIQQQKLSQLAAVKEEAAERAKAQQEGIKDTLISNIQASVQNVGSRRQEAATESVGIAQERVSEADSTQDKLFAEQVKIENELSKLKLDLEVARSKESTAANLESIKSIEAAQKASIQSLKENQSAITGNDSERQDAAANLGVAERSQSNVEGGGALLDAGNAAADAFAIGGPIAAIIAGFTSLSDHFGLLDKVLAPAFSILESLTPAFESIFDAMSIVLDAIAPIIDVVKAIAFPALTFALQLFGKGIAVVGLVINGIALGLVSFVKAIIDAIKGFADFFGGNDAIDRTARDLGKTKRELEDNQDQLLETIAAPFGAAEKIKAAENKQAKKAADQAKTAQDNATNSVDKLAESAKEAAEQITNLPEIFRARLRESQAANRSEDVVTSNLLENSEGPINIADPTSTVIEGDVIIQGTTVEEAIKELKRGNFIRTGSISSNNAPFPVGGRI